MIDYITKINHSIIKATSDKNDSLCKIFVAKPLPGQEKKFGKLFGLIKVDAVGEKYGELIDLIIEQFKSNYYNQILEEEKTYGNGRLANQPLELESKFETAIYKTNKALERFLEQNSIELDKINVLIAAIKSQSLIFTQIGDINAYLMHFRKKNDYGILNIYEDANLRIRPINPLNIFSQTTNGSIGATDFLFISTPNIFDYFSLERIKNIIINKPLNEATKEFQQLLSLVKMYDLIAFLILNLEAAPVTAARNDISVLENFDYSAAMSKDSMAELDKSRKITEQILSPSLLPEMKKISKFFKSGFQKYLNAIDKFSLKNPYTKRKTQTPYLDQAYQKRDKKVIIFIKALGSKIKLISTKIIANPLFKKITELLVLLFSRLYSRFKKLRPYHKFLVISSIILAILFVNYTANLAINNAREREQNRINQLIAAIAQKKDGAEASVIYQNEERSRLLLLEAKKILLELPETSRQRPDVIALEKEINMKLEEYRHEVSLGEPVMLANFKNLNAQAKIAPLLINVGSNAYTQDNNNKLIYKLKLDNRIISSILSPLENIENFYVGTNYQGNQILFFDQNLTFYSFNSDTDELKKIPINLSTNPKITALATYQEWLYALDIKNNQILKYSYTPDGFSRFTKWLTDSSVDLKDAIDMVIDTNVYVLKSTGEIIKLQKGKLVNFSLSIIDPPLKSPTKIKTTEVSNYLYILDPANKRVVIFDKKGVYVKQYNSDIFDNMQDIIIMEKENKIFVLNSSSVYGIPLDFK